MVRSWTDEKRYFRRAALPKFSTTGRWSDVGHYTQIIWHSTTDVGCAIAVSQSDEYLVCRYTTPGNDYEIGRASGRERVCQYGYIPGVAVSLKTKKTYKNTVSE